MPHSGRLRPHPEALDKAEKACQEQTLQLFGTIRRLRIKLSAVTRGFMRNKDMEKLTGRENDRPGNTKGGSITVPLTSCLTGFD